MIVFAFVGLLLAGLLFSWFTRLYRDGRPEVVLGVLVGVWLGEAFLNSGAASVEQGGIFRPVIAGQDFRPPDLVILVAVAVQVLQSRRVGVVRWPALAWGLFGLWYSAAGLYGLLSGNPTSEVLFHGKAVFYILGAATVAARVDLVAMLRRPSFDTWRWVICGTSAVLVVGTLVGLQLSVRLPGLSIPRAGTLSNDSITMVVGLGVLFALTHSTVVHRSTLLFVLTSVMIVAPVAANQRANFVGFGGTMAVIVVALAGSAWRTRVRVTGVQAGIFAAAFLVLGVLGSFLGGPSTDLFAKFDDTFFAGVESQTTAVRQETWRQAREMLMERPLTGHGLGIEQTIGPVGRDVWQGSKAEAREITSHNLFFDLGLRSGFTGIALFAMAALATLYSGARVWRRHSDVVVSAFVLGCLAMMSGIVAKGMVESVLEKFRLDVALGLVIGLIAAADRSLLEEDEADPRRLISRRAR